MATSADTLSALSDVQTIGQLRAALGVITAYLKSGYDLLPSISTDQGLRASTQSLLDDANTYAKTIYDNQPTDLPAQAYEVSWQDSARLGLLASQTETALNRVTASANASDFQLGPALKAAVAQVGAGISDAANAVGDTAGNVAAAPFKGLLAALVAFLDGAKTVIIIGGVVVVIYVFRKPLLGQLGKVGS
jgi:hypothetical protein